MIITVYRKHGKTSLQATWKTESEWQKPLNTKLCPDNTELLQQTSVFTLKTSKTKVSNYKSAATAKNSSTDTNAITM